LRNPLAPIRAALQVLRQTSDPAAAMRMREVMERQVNHMVRLIAAIDAFQRIQPDLVLLDIGMPEMDGYEVARRLRVQQGSRRPILVALTGWGAANDRARSAEAGFDLHLTKPVDFDTLTAALQKPQAAGATAG